MIGIEMDPASAFAKLMKSYQKTAIYTYDVSCNSAARKAFKDSLLNNEWKESLSNHPLPESTVVKFVSLFPAKPTDLGQVFKDDIERAAEAAEKLDASFKIDSQLLGLAGRDEVGCRGG